MLSGNAVACVRLFGNDATLRLFCLFGLHHHECFTRPLVVGGTTVLLPHGSLVESLADVCASSKVNQLIANPAIASRFGRDERLDQVRGTLKVVEIGGGIIHPQLVERIHRRTDAAVVVCYGSTETSGEALAGRPSPESSCNILYPIDGYVARIINERGNDADPGQPGELLISGSAVADAYLVPPPGETRLRHHTFFTKDLAENVDGGIRILGRIDAAVKMLSTRQALEPLESELSRVLQDMAEGLQLLDVEPQGWGRRVGLGGSLIVIVCPTDEARKLGDSGCTRELCRRIRRARLEAYLTMPVALIVADEEETSWLGGKVQRQVARRCFPFSLEGWEPQRAARLAWISPTLASWGRTFRRLLANSGAVATPTGLAAAFSRRMIRALIPRMRRGRLTMRSLPWTSLKWLLLVAVVYSVLHLLWPAW